MSQDLKTSLKTSAQSLVKDILADTKDAILNPSPVEGPSVAGMKIPVSKKQSRVCEVKSFKDASVYLVFDKEGNASTRKRVDILDEPVCNLATLTKSTIEFELPIQVKGLKSVTLNFGMFILSGPSGVGKSSFMRSLAKVMNINRVLAVEPADTYDELANLPIRYSADSAVAYLVQQFIKGNRALPVLDSLREPLFEIEGSAADKGIINAFFTRVTNVSTSLAQNGITMVATINPLGEDPAFLQVFYSRLKSSTPGYMILKSVEGPQDNLTYRGVIAMRPDRVERDFVFNVRTAQTGPVGQDLAEEVSFIMSEEPSSADISLSTRNQNNAISHTA